MRSHRIEGPFTQNPGFVNLCPELFRAALGMLNWSEADLASASGIPAAPLRRYAQGDLSALTEDQLYMITAGFCWTLAFTLRGDLAKGVMFAAWCAPVSLEAGIDWRPPQHWKAAPSAFDARQTFARNRVRRA